MSMAWIIGVHGDRRIAQHCFRPRVVATTNDVPVRRERIADVKELALHVFMFHFMSDRAVRQRGHQWISRSPR
jgi:hypothetical protein